MLILNKDLTVWLGVAKKAAHKAGEFLLQPKNSVKDILSDSGRDIKLEVDIKSESIIIDHLENRSDFSILSEEKGLIKRSNQDFTWIIDPLDGSLNYMRGIPFCCVSIGLWQEDTPILGVVYDFYRSELFYGVVDEGVWVDQQPLKVSSTTQKEKAVLCTGFPVSTDFSHDSINAFVGKIRLYKKVRLLGSAALSIVYVASGRADVYEEKDIMFWDVAGAIPILLGAGGMVKKEKTKKLHSLHIYASNGHL